MRRHLREFLYSYKNYVLTLRFAAYKTPQIYQLFFILQNLLSQLDNIFLIVPQNH